MANCFNTPLVNVRVAPWMVTDALSSAGHLDATDSPCEHHWHLKKE
jgi:hypothetical protein